MPLVILTVILPDPDATRVPWGINPRHVTEVAHHQHPDLCTVAITRGGRTEAHDVTGSVPEVVALLNHDADALDHLADVAAWRRYHDKQADRMANVHPGYITEADRADRAALDRLAAMLRFHTWPGASAIEDVAEVVGSVRDLTTGPVVEDWPSH